MQRRYAWVLFSLFLFAQTTCHGQEQKRILSGHIREEGSGHLLSGVHIELQNALGTPVAFAYSDGNGVYEFDNMGGDSYVVAEYKGYISSHEFVRPDGSGHVYKDIFLRPVDANSASNSGNPVSQHQLSIPPKARESFDKGVQLVVEKADYRGAITQFERAIAKYPSYYEAYAAMGLAQHKMANVEAAEASFRKSMELSAEKYPQAMMDLAAMLNSLNRFPEAEPVLRKVIALDASSWRGQFELANTLIGLKRIPEAVTCAATARDLKPDYPQTHLLLYNLHIQTDDLPAALEDADAYLKIAPTGPMAERVRRMREQVQKAVESPTPASPPAAEPLSEEPAAAKRSTVPASSAPSSTSDSVITPHVDQSAPAVSTNVPCSLFSVLQGAGQRAEQLLNSLERFDAAERVEHYRVNGAGSLGAADVRSFDYVVAVSKDSNGGFHLQEYRNGSIVSPEQFPSGIVTSNLSVHALIFHPTLAPGFNFVCEGLGDSGGRPAWLVHFETKQDFPNPFRSYVINGVSYPVLLTGRAWIEAGTYQVLRLESDLIKPVEKIHLTREHISIEFGLVQFRTNNQQLWLPQTANLYVDLDGHRFYRRHTFSNFKIFSTDTAQEIQAPKESYCFRNTSTVPVTGTLNATPVSGAGFLPASITITIPAKSTVCERVGPGKDINIPAESLLSTTFAHDGPAGSVEADAHLLNGSALEVISNRNAPANQNP